MDTDRAAKEAVVAPRTPSLVAIYSRPYSYTYNRTFDAVYGRSFAAIYGRTFNQMYERPRPF